jgi:hypothetical protein
MTAQPWTAEDIAEIDIGPLGLADYLSAVEAYLRHYVAFPSEHEPVAIALWVAHAHLIESFEVSPTLAVTSAEMRSGKTRVLDCLELLVPEPFRVVIPSEAVVYTILAQRPRPTMLLDEADAIFGPRTAEKYEGLRAILNSGNRRGTPVLRVKLDGRRREVDAFDVFGPKAIAGIGNLPSTVADRSIPIRMKRRMPDEPIARFRQRTATAEASEIVGDWSAVTVVTDVTVPGELNDRAADSWEPLLQVADTAGGSWGMRARLAAVALSSEEEMTVSVGMRLLADVQEAFGDEDHLTTAELLRRLHDLEDAPWLDWYGSPLSGRGLAKLLGGYRVMPIHRRVRGVESRGYFAADFKDAWSRYIPAPERDAETPISPWVGYRDQGDDTEAPVPAPEPVTSVTPVTPAPVATDTVACSDASGHSTSIRRAGNGWVCDICSGATA